MSGPMRTRCSFSPAMALLKLDSIQMKSSLSAISHKPASQEHTPTGKNWPDFAFQPSSKNRS
jgi:ornithine carbamoyltransferase